MPAFEYAFACSGVAPAAIHALKSVVCFTALAFLLASIVRAVICAADSGALNRTFSPPPKSTDAAIASCAARASCPRPSTSVIRVVLLSNSNGAEPKLGRERDGFVASTPNPRFNAADSAPPARVADGGAADGISSDGRIDRAAGSIVSSAGGATR